jgi:uncharacterized DUF497 family protein
MNDSFEWDPEKEKANVTKHGIDFDEATTVFNDPLVVMRPDAEHSVVEERFSAIGMSFYGRLPIVAYTERGDRIRIINARTPTRRETKTYEGSRPGR